jgi:hypothetical protein
MKTSTSITKIAPALLAAQRAMTAATKGAENPHFRSKYADLATIIEAVKGPLNNAGITFMQSPQGDATGVMVETMLLHESGEWLADTVYLPVPQQTPVAYGSAITYGKRYGLQSLTGLPSEDDDGEHASEPAKEGAPRVQPGPPRKMRPRDFQEHCTAMAQATKMETLQKAYTAAVLQARGIGDEDAVQSFQRKKDEIKEMIATANAMELASQP